MISLFRKTKVELKTLQYVLFNYYIPHKVNLKLPAKYVTKNIMKFEEIGEEMKNDYVKELLSSYAYRASKTTNYIKKYFENNNKNEEIIKREIYKNTFFDRCFDVWNITNLARKYQITGKEVFTEFVKNSQPFGMGYFDNNQEKNKIEEIEKYWSQWMDRGYVYVDYYNGIGVKNSFPVDIFENNFILNIRRYNDRNSFENNGFWKVLDILNEKIDKVKTGELVLQDFEQYEEKKIIVENSNKRVRNELEEIAFEEGEVKVQGYFNHRLFVDNVWDYMLFPENEVGEYYQFIKEGIENDVFDLSNYFTIIKNRLIPNDNVKLENLSIVNCLIFGKTRIRLEDVEKLMSLVRYHGNNSIYYLDNYVVDFNKKYFKESNYFISINAEVDDLDFYNDDETKNNIAKYIVQIMNEVRPDLLNHHNYNILVKYLRNMAVEEYRFWNLVPNERQRIKRIKFN